jgi:hypothetical protein
MLFLAEEILKCPSPASAPAAPYLESLLLSGALTNFPCKADRKYFAFEPGPGTKCQLHTQCKLTTPRRENQKIRHESVNLKQGNTICLYWNFRLGWSRK